MTTGARYCSDPIQSEPALTRLGLQIEEEVRSLRAHLNQVKGTSPWVVDTLILDLA